MKKILIVSPHPDDEVLGCGGSILKYKKNNFKVYWLIITSIKNSKNFSKKQILDRETEINKVKSFFNFDKVINLNIEPKFISQMPEAKLIEQVTKVVLDIKPNKIYLPFISDSHTDHTYTAKAFSSVIKSFRNNYIQKVLFYETISETNFNFLNERKFNPNVFNDISLFIDKKIQAMKIYKSEIKKHPFPRSKDSIKSLALLRGSQCNSKYAEAFELVYEIIK